MKISEISYHDMITPNHKIYNLKDKSSDYCVCIPVLNEGEKIISQLQQMQEIGIDKVADILVFDGGSTDGSMDIEKLKSLGIRALIVKEDTGKLAAQLRMGYKWALEQDYKGFITIDGNGKDNVEAVFKFIKYLEDGFDFVKGSRFIKGGVAINTPLSRYFAIRFIHSPFISMLSHHWFTDTTNAYAAYSRNLLLDSRINIFRPIFDTYQILFYLHIKAARLGYKVIEIPVERRYPAEGKVPTKINLKGSIGIIWNLFELMFGKFKVR